MWAYLKTWITNVDSYIFVYSEWRWELIVGFVDIGDHHCLNFLFIRMAFRVVGEIWLGLWWLTPISTKVHLYLGGQFYWWRKPECTTCRKLLTNFSNISSNYNAIMWKIERNSRVNFNNWKVICQDSRVIVNNLRVNMSSQWHEWPLLAFFLYVSFLWPFLVFLVRQYVGFETPMTSLYIVWMEYTILASVFNINSNWLVLVLLFSCWLYKLLDNYLF